MTWRTSRRTAWLSGKSLDDFWENGGPDPPGFRGHIALNYALVAKEVREVISQKDRG